MVPIVGQALPPLAHPAARPSPAFARSSCRRPGSGSRAGPPVAAGQAPPPPPPHTHPPPCPLLHPTAGKLTAHPEAAKFRYAPLAEEEKMSEVFDNCCVTNEHARVPTPSYQDDPSRIILEDDSGCESQECQVTPIQNRGKSGKKWACPYSPSPKMNDKWAGENAKNEAFVRMMDLFSARDKRDAEGSAREKREAEESAREKREAEESVDGTIAV